MAPRQAAQHPDAMSTDPDDASTVPATSAPDGAPPPAVTVVEAPTGRWVPILYLVLCLGLIPWIAVLAQTLPNRALNHNYRLAWVGFDILLTLAMARTAWLAWRRSPYVVNVAA